MDKSLLLALRFLFGFAISFFILSFRFGFRLWFFMLFVSVIIRVFVLFVIISQSYFIISLMLNSQIILETVGKDLINNDASDLKVLLELLSLGHLLFCCLELIEIWWIDWSEEVEEGFCSDLLCNYSLLACFFIFLFLFHLF